MYYILAILVLFMAAAEAQEAASYLDAGLPIPDTMIRPMPADGSESATNPPAFLWLPEPNAATYTLQYSQSKDFVEAVTVEGLKLNLHPPTQAIQAGKWFWRYQAINADGTTSAWSSIRSFTMPKDAVRLTLPPMDKVRASVLRGRPRLFVRPEGLESLRESRSGARKDLWPNLEKQIEAQFNKPLMPEPERYPDDKRVIETWRTLYRDIRVMATALDYLAFGYLVTGQREYADEAKRIMLHFCEWDPQGTTSYRYNDETAMPIALSTSRAYDWIWNTMTSEERARVTAMMRIRAGELYEILRRMPYESKPYNSHSQRALMFLGEASIAFMGEIPECEEWLEYVLSVYTCIYPPWGGADGSYSEGPWYWAGYMSWALQFIDALQGATGADLCGKPYFRNTGWYALYCIPPHTKSMVFGDGSWLEPSSGHANEMYRFASINRNPYFRWYAEAMGAPSNNPMNYLHRDDSLKAKPPTDLPPSRAFYDMGLVAMHTNLENEDETFFLMRSSPGGSCSHAYADQNAFYLQAFGEPLAIESGFRPYYGAPHHYGWTKLTKAHNSILVNGNGQTFQSRSAQGRITSAVFGESFDYACGDAAKAYDGKLSKFLRHVVFLRPDFFVLIDEVSAPKASRFDWLLHSWEKMDLAENQATISKGDARLLADFAWPESLALSQTNQFDVPPDNGSPNQWHLSASTSLTKEECFVTVLYPYKAGTPLAEIERIEAPGARGVEIRRGDVVDTVIVNRFSSPLAGMRIKSDGHIAALREIAGKPSALLMVDGTYFRVGNDELLRTDSPITTSIEIGH